MYQHVIMSVLHQSVLILPASFAIYILQLLHNSFLICAECQITTVSENETILHLMLFCSYRDPVSMVPGRTSVVLQSVRPTKDLVGGQSILPSPL